MSAYRSLVLADRPVAYWRLGEASGTTAADASGHARTGTIAGSGVTYGVAGYFADDADTALTFDGAAGRVDVAAAETPNFGTGPCSIECWFKTTSAAGPFVLDNKAGSGGVAGFAIQVATTQVIAFVGGAGVGAYNLGTPVGATIWNDDAWHHVVVTLERGASDTLKIYVDAVLLATGTVSTTGWDLTPSQPLLIGAKLFGTAYFAGTIDEVALYDHVLSAGRIAIHYAGVRIYRFKVRRGSVQIHDTVGSAPTTLTLTLQGERPPGTAAVRLALEPVTRRLMATIAGADAAALPGDVVDLTAPPWLFDGVLQTVEEHYDGLPTQRAWTCTAIDHVYDLNKRRPFGVFEDVAAHTVIETIMGTYAPGFTLDFVQQIEVLVSITLTGELEMSAALTAIAVQLGACYWYLDGFDLHFYHLGINDGDVVTETRPSPPTALTAPTVSGTVTRSASPTFLKGWSLFSLAYVYSSGLESQRSDSVLVDVDAGFAMEFSAIPLGPSFAGMAVTRRYLYQNVFGYYGGGNVSQRWVYVIDDNTTSVFELSDVPVASARVPPVRFDEAPAPTTACSFTASGSGASFSPGDYQFAVSYVYETGVQSARGPWSSPLTLTGAEGLFTFAALPIGAPNVDGKVVLIRVLHVGFGSVLPYSAEALCCVPDNSSTTWEVETLHVGPPAFFLGYGGPVGGTHRVMDYRSDDLPTSGAPTFGPSLEDDLLQPDTLTDDSPTLIHHSPPLTSSEDDSQLRTRVFVKGASRGLTTATVGTDTALVVDDITPFDVGGGQVLIGAVVLAYASISGSTLVLAAGVTVDAIYPVGTPVFLWVQCDDFIAQAELGTREAVAGIPSDGVREFTVVNSSLDSVAQCLARGYAELTLYARPILTVQYGTYDRKTRAGRLVAIDLTDPPLVHPGLLIQDVTIDQIEVGPAPWPPRYTVTASSVRFTLDDLLRHVALTDGA